MGRREIGWIGAVGCVALGVQGWLWWTSPVPSLDAIRFVRSAARVEAQGLAEAFSQVQEAPLWIGWLWAVHQTVGAIWGQGPAIWAWSVSLAAVVPLLAAFGLVTLLAIRFWGTRRGLGAGLLFCTLPEVSRLGPDGLSDSLHLALAAGALLALVEGMSQKGKKSACFWFGAGGFLCGLASLVRAEVLAVCGAWIVAWVLLGWRRKEEWNLSQVLMPIGLFLVGFGGVLGAYAQATGMTSLGELVSIWSGAGEAEFSPSLARISSVEGNPIAQKNFLLSESPPEAPFREEYAPDWRLPDGTPLCFDAKESTVSLRRRGWGPMLLRTLHKTADVWGYWVGGLALVGLMMGGRRQTEGKRSFRPETLFLGLTAGLVFAGAFAYGTWVGYLEARHLVLMVVCGIGAAGAGAEHLGCWLAKGLSVRPSVQPLPVCLSSDQEGQTAVSPSVPLSSLLVPRSFLFRRLTFAGGNRGTWVRFVPLAAAVVGSLLAQVGGVHRSRVGHRLAGIYLAHHASPQAFVVDTRGWTGLFSGRCTYPYAESARLLTDPRLEYLVLESWEHSLDSPRAKTLHFLLKEAGRRIAVFPSDRENLSGMAWVEVYRWDAARFQRQMQRLAHTQTSPKTNGKYQEALGQNSRGLGQIK